MKYNLPQTGYTRLPEPTKAEVEMAIQKLSEKYHNAFSYDDAARFITLSRELKIWQEIEKDVDSDANITKEDAEKTQLIHKQKGENISLKRAYLEAEKGLVTVIATEMMRVTNELEALINGHLS